MKLHIHPKVKRGGEGSGSDKTSPGRASPQNTLQAKV